MAERRRTPRRAHEARREELEFEWETSVTVCGSRERDLFVLAHAPLIRSVAHRIQSKLPSSIELSDLINDGVLGLIEAIDRFDPNRGVPFEAFAWLRIRGAILDSLRARDIAPRSLRRRVREVEAASQQARQRLGHPPDDGEIAEEMGVAQDLVAGLRLDHEWTRTASMEMHRSEALPEACIDPRALDPFEEASHRQVQGRLMELVLELPERERLILGLYYDEELTMKGIADLFGITESRICQLHTKSVKDLRTSLHRLLHDDIHRSRA